MIPLLLAAALLGCGPKTASELGPTPEVDPAHQAEQAAAAARPQTPKPPLPYPTREVTVEAPDGVALAGTLSLPEGAGPHPAILMLTGSGAQDRDETIAGHKPFAVWADHLARKGIATLRLDDRGTGGSGGSLAAATSTALKLDADAALRSLAAQEGVDPKRIGVLGHSEGATIAGLAATDHPDLAAVVLLAAPAVDGRELLIAQASAILKAAGAPQDALTRHAVAHEAALDALGSDGQREAFRHLMEVQIAIAVEHLGAEAPADLEPLVDGAIAQVNSPSFLSMMKQHPSETLAGLKMPILAVGGSLDLQVLPRQNLDTLSRVLEGHPDAQVLEFPGLNHLFQHAGQGTPQEYALIPETVAPEVLDAVSAWLVERLKP